MYRLFPRLARSWECSSACRIAHSSRSAQLPKTQRSTRRGRRIGTIKPRTLKCVQARSVPRFIVPPNVELILDLTRERIQQRMLQVRTYTFRLLREEMVVE